MVNLSIIDWTNIDQASTQMAKMENGNAKKTNQKAYLIQAFKIAGTMMCYLGCILNSKEILSNFFRQSKVVSINMNTYPSLLLPSVTICNNTAYKESIHSFQDLERDRFLNNTLILSEVLRLIAFEASNREDADRFWYHDDFTNWKLGSATG